MKSEIVAVALLSLASFPAAHAGPSPDPALYPECNGPEILEVSVPVDYADPDSPRFALSFRYHQGTAKKPVIIVLPGGPGGTGIVGSGGKELLGSIPAEYSVISTDPRGAGCNDLPALSSERYFRTEWLARDVLEIVRFLEKRQGGPLDYVLYGQSYGTMQATVTASLASREGITPPRALVLEGTVGHSFKNFAEYFGGIQAEWLDVRPGLSEHWRHVFMNGDFPLVPSRVWALYTEKDLLAGYDPQLGHQFLWHLSGGGNMMLLMGLQDIDASTSHGEKVIANEVGRVIACRELFGDVENLRDFRGGELIADGGDICGKIGGIQERYDSADWPVRVPIVYFQGEHDPATPLAHARHHFAAQSGTSRYFVLLDRAAHAPLTLSLNAGDCPARIWDAISGDIRQISSAVDHCQDLQPARISLEALPSGSILAR